MKKLEKVHVRLEPEKIEQLKIIAKETHQTRCALCREILTRYLKRQEKKI